jgi:hypothetical protein
MTGHARRAAVALPFIQRLEQKIDDAGGIGAGGNGAGQREAQLKDIAVIRALWRLGAFVGNGRFSPAVAQSTTFRRPLQGGRRADRLAPARTVQTSFGCRSISSAPRC